MREKDHKTTNLTDQSKAISYSEHIPIACHYNTRTLLTKNGELLQVIYMDGFARSDGSRFFSSNLNIREAIRASLIKNTASKDLAIYLHVIRDRTSIALSSASSSPNVNKIYEDWNKLYRWDKQLVNSLFITIVHKGIRGSVNLSNAAFFSLMCAKVHKKLKEAEAVLSAVVDNVSDELKSFGAYILAIRKKEEKEVYVSDLLSFYYRLIYLRRKEIEIDICDISHQLEKDLLLFYGFNHAEISNTYLSKRSYAAIYTLKYPYHLSLELCDNILNIDQHIIISETIYPTSTSIAMKSWQNYIDTYRASGDEELSHSLEIDELSTHKIYCKQQLSILVHANEFEIFQVQLKHISSLLKSEGIVIVREDFYMPAAIWSILPGNSRYLAREKYNTLDRAAIFSSIHHRNIGGYNGSRWGEAICIFQNIYNVPYYFNFHAKNGNGNTLIIGPKESGPDILIRFLLIQALRNHPRIIIIDNQGKTKNFVSTIGGQNIDISSDDTRLNFNLFNLQNFTSEEKWLNLFSQALFGDLLPLEDNSFKKVLLNLLTLDNLPNYIAELLADDKTTKRGLIEHIQELVESPAYLKSMANNSLTPLKNWQGIINIDCSSIPSKYQIIYTSMLLKNLVEFFDGMPAIIAIPNADYLLNLDKTEFNDFLQQAYKNNCLVLLSLSQKDYFFEQENLPNLLAHCPTKFFLSDRLADKNYKKLFELSDLELHRIKIYDKSRRIFLLKQDETSISASFNLSENKDILEVDL